MERTICDRCGQPIQGALSIVGLWGADGIQGSGLPHMNGLPAVRVMNLCPACRKKVEAAMRRCMPVAPGLALAPADE